MATSMGYNPGQSLTVIVSDSNQAICHGDSGGSIMLQDKNGLKLVAVISRGDCQIYGVGNLVWNKQAWIKSTIQALRGL